jgi:hypothetical protein
MSVDLPLPIPTGGATSMVGAANAVSADASASAGGQGAASVFDALMAALGPVTIADDAAVDDTAVPSATAPAGSTIASKADSAAVPLPAPAVLPQMIAEVQSAPPEPAAATPAPPAPPQASAPLIAAAKATDMASVAAPATADDSKASDADAPAVQTPAQPVAAVPATPVAAEPVPVVAPNEAPQPVRPPAPKGRAAAAGDVKATGADSDDTAPAAAVADTAPSPAVVAQLQVQPQSPASTQAPKASPSRLSAQAAAAAVPLAGNQVPAPKATGAATATPADDQPKTFDAQAAGIQPADTAATDATAPQTATPARVQPQPKADTLAGSLKAARKALAEEAVPAPRSQTPSGFSLQAQVEAPGAYTATGAQSAGTTGAGSNLARATVETLSGMAVQINRKLSEGNTKFAVELHPADLGKVEVTLSIARDGTTTAHLKFDTPVTAAAFQAQEGELRQQLAQTGLNLDSGSLTFSSRDDGNAGFNQAFAQMQQQNQPQEQQNRQSQARAFKNAAAIAADADASAAVDAGLLAQRIGVSSTLALNLIV